MRHFVRVLLALAVLPASAPRLAAQATPPTVSDAPAPRRPKLDKTADPNDWAAYYRYGIQRFEVHRPAEAEAAFWWASQLNPERAEPIFAQWAAFWSRDPKLWTMYVADDAHVLSRPDVIAANALPRRALERNPFVHQGLVVMIYNEMPGEWMSDDLTRGWLNYAQSKFDLATRDLGKALRRNGKAHEWIRTMRAQAFLSMGQFDSTVAELRALEAELSARDQRTLGASLESKAMLHYALGVLAGARGQPAEARAELGAALTENLAFAPAHDVLAQVLLAQGDTAAALPESEQAAQLAPEDAVIQYHHGAMMMIANRPADAVAPLRRAAALRPWYAAPYYELGLALDRTGDREGARAALARFAELAPRADAARIAAARAY